MALAFSAPVVLASRAPYSQLRILQQNASKRFRAKTHARAPRCAIAATPTLVPVPPEREGKPLSATPDNVKHRKLIPKIARDAWESAQVVLNLAKPELRTVLKGVLFAALSSLSVLIAPFTFSRVLDSICTGGAGLRRRSLLLLVVYIVSATLKYLETRAVRSAAYRVGASVRTRAFNSLVRAEVSALPRAGGVGGALSALAADAGVVEWAATEELGRLCTGALEALVAFVALLLLCAPMATIAGIVTPVALMLGARFGARAAIAARKRSAAQAAASSAAAAHLGALDTVKSFAAEGAAEGRYASGVLDARFWGLNAARAAARLEAWNRLLFTLSTVSVLSAGGAFVGAGRLSVGAMMAFAIYANVLNAALAKATLALSALVRASGPAERLTNLLALSAEDRERKGEAAVATGGAKSVEFRDVSFAYPGSGRLALARASFTVPAGSSAAFVGVSGAGKSTILSLLSRFHKAVRGKVVIGGEDVTTFSAGALRGEVLGVVSQDARMLPGTIRENIELGCVGADASEVEQASREAGVLAFAKDLEHGLDESAEGLSGGQRQRVNIARCLLRKAPVLVADEPCTGLDAISAKFVTESLERLMRDQGTTVLLISHNIVRARMCDKIFVVDGGRIVEEGTHEELVARNGYYRRLLDAASSIDDAFASSPVG